MNDAAIDALKFIWSNYPDYKDNEYGGWIFKTSKGYTYCDVVKVQEGVGLGYRAPDGAAGWFHSHYIPSIIQVAFGFNGEQFSVPEDVNISERTKQPGFVGTPSKRILMYNPDPNRNGKLKGVKKIWP